MTGSASSSKSAIPRRPNRSWTDNPAISAALPCRISIYQENGKTRIASILPTALLSMFPNPELKPVAEEVERTIVRIMQELA